jgi:hypothetical protein
MRLDSAVRAFPEQGNNVLDRSSLHGLKEERSSQMQRRQAHVNISSHFVGRAIGDVSLHAGSAQVISNVSGHAVLPSGTLL